MRLLAGPPAVPVLSLFSLRSGPTPSYQRFAKPMILKDRVGWLRELWGAKHAHNPKAAMAEIDERAKGQPFRIEGPAGPMFERMRFGCFAGHSVLVHESDPGPPTWNGEWQIEDAALEVAWDKFRKRPRGPLRRHGRSDRVSGHDRRRLSPAGRHGVQVEGVGAGPLVSLLRLLGPWHLMRPGGELRS
jgi:hypothetical protein